MKDLPFFLMVIIVIAIMLSGCKPTTIFRDREVYVRDTTAEQHLQQEKDSLVSELESYRSEKTEILRELASMQRDSGQVLDDLPVLYFEKRAGDAFFRMNYQGAVNWSEFYVPARESRNREVTDSSTYFRDRWHWAQDSVSSLHNRLEQAREHTREVVELGWWEKIWVLVKNAWWLLIVGVVAYAVLRRWVPFLP